MKEMLNDLLNSRKLKGTALGTIGVALAGGDTVIASIAALLAGLQIVTQFLLDWKHGRAAQTLATKPGYDPETQTVEE
jgi:hypothetical protein